MRCQMLQNFPAGPYLFKVNNGNTRKICEVCLKFTKKITFTDTNKDVTDVVLVSLSLALNRFDTLPLCFHC